MPRSSTPIFSFSAGAFTASTTVEADGGNIVGVLPQKGLIGVAVEQTGRSGVTALLVEKKRQHFHDPAGYGVRRVGGGHEARRSKKNSSARMAKR